MSDKYPALSFDSMPVGVSYTRPSQPRPEGLTLDSPALGGMTDLRVLTALTVERTNTLSAALERMRKLGVRMLLVTGSTGAVMGIVTVTDIESGRAEKIAAKTGEEPMSLQVQDIMTLRGRLEVIPLDKVESASIGQMLATMRDAGRRHALVLWQNSESGSEEICGIFSVTRLASLLNLEIKPGDPMEKINSVLDQHLS